MDLVQSQQPLQVKTPGWRGVVGWVGCLFAGVFYFSTVVLINGLQVLSLIVLPFSRSVFRSLNRWFAGSWWAWCVVGAERVFGCRPVFSGDEIPVGENALVFANHQQMPDILAIMMLAHSKRRLGDMKWFVKDPLKHVPGIGWGMQFLDCIFVKRDWLADKRRILGTFEKFLRFKIPIWLITFVEGTRITPEKLARSNDYCARKKLTPFRHVMYPRSRGFTAALEGLEGHLEAVYDVTIGYDGAIPKLSQIYRGQVRRIFIDVKRFPIAALPKGEAERAAWLHERFVRKDRLLEKLYKTGQF